MPATWYVGLDLGTTNSCCAVFDGDQLHEIRSAQGGVLTPSVVRISGKGTTTVGARARKSLEVDPKNTRSEFKRLMGTPSTLSFEAAGVERKPQELSAEILRSMLHDVTAQLGFVPKTAVVTVPALFEVPQSAATAEAARMAGLEQVELLQEPVASALAAGWSADGEAGTWLVFDLGGGTFDVSLLETRDGLLRVVGHSGDNFLGGRDIDRALVDWVLAELHRAEGVELRRDDPRHASALRALAFAAEEAKVELSREERTVLSTRAPLMVDGELVDVELELDRATLERLAAPVVDKALSVCADLLTEHGLVPSQVERVVLVGGPTVMPMVRRAVQTRLAPTADTGLDPMTLVARGAALFAASAGLDAISGPTRAAPVDMEQTEPEAGAVHLWLQYPTMSADLEPFVLGQAGEGSRGRLGAVRLQRADGGWSGEPVALDAEGVFCAQARLLPHTPNVLTIEGFDRSGRRVPVHPPSVTIVHGVAISDPPLSRSVGVALANGRVRVFFERGTPLPTKRTFVQHTADSISPGSGAPALKVPIVQGEFDRAELCRLIGSLEVDGDAVGRELPVGSPIEITLELDRGGRLSAQARLPRVDRLFEGVAQLLVPACSVEVLEAQVAACRERLAPLQTTAFAERDRVAIEILQGLVAQLEDAERFASAVKGGDDDAGQRARRIVLDVEARVHELEALRIWPELDADAAETAANAAGLVSRFGSDAERRLLEDALKGLERARESRAIGALQRQVRILDRLASAAYYRIPGAWSGEFDYAAARVHEAKDPARAKALVDQGRRAQEREDENALRDVVRQLWSVLPAAAEDRRKSHDSGVQ